jgi:hypothetical protein
MLALNWVLTKHMERNKITIKDRQLEVQVAKYYGELIGYEEKLEERE